MSDLKQPLNLGDIRVDTQYNLPYLVIRLFSKDLTATPGLKRLYLTPALDISNNFAPSEEDIFICNIHKALVSIGEKVLKYAGID